MSQTAMSAPRLSMFTFESTAHSSHVLHRLDEQRRRDMLCDVTVVVEGQSFRAHRSVLASCSEYFTHRVSSLTQHGDVITLPQEVSVAGFEPLLKFAYTSKLFFGNDNVLQIKNSASVLGFRDLDEACFDFLLPKMIPAAESPASFPRKTCLKKTCRTGLSKGGCAKESDNVLLGDKEVKPVDDSSSQQEVVWPCNKSSSVSTASQSSAGTVPPVAEGTKVHFMQCPKYRKFQLACGKETCVPEKSPNNPVSVIKDEPPGFQCCASVNGGREFPGKHKANEPRKTETHDTKTEEYQCSGGVERDVCERQGKWDMTGTEMDVVKMEDEMECVDVKAVLGERSPGLMMHHCPLKAFDEGPAISASLEERCFVNNMAEDKKTWDSGRGQPVSVHQKVDEVIKPGGERVENKIDAVGREEGQTCKEEQGNIVVKSDVERGNVEWEVAEHLARRLGSDVCSSQLELRDNDAGSSTDSGSRLQNTSVEWLQVNLSSRSSSCPFLLQDLDQSKWKENASSECEGASQSGVSSLNSGEDGDSETEGESERYSRERARQVQLPYPVDWIVDLSRNDFQQLLKQHDFTHEQLEFVHDMRRRSKNRLAAQRCRKRKLDCIYNLQCEINKLKTEREKLILEKGQLSQLKLKTCHSVSSLCQRVCREANLQPEQLQVLAKYTSSDCPLSSLCPHVDSFQTQGLDGYTAPEEASSSSGRDTLTGDCQQSCAAEAPSTDTCADFQ